VAVVAAPALVLFEQTVEELRRHDAPPLHGSPRVIRNYGDVAAGLCPRWCHLLIGPKAVPLRALRPLSSVSAELERGKQYGCRNPTYDSDAALRTSAIGALGQKRVSRLATNIFCKADRRPPKCNALECRCTDSGALNDIGRHNGNREPTRAIATGERRCTRAHATVERFG